LTEPAHLSAPGTLQPKTQNPRPKTATGAAPLIVDGSEHFLALTLPSREHPHYATLLDLVKSNGFVLEPSNRKWWLRDRHNTLNFLAGQATRLRDQLDAQ